jgi:hypothetical protein
MAEKFPSTSISAMASSVFTHGELRQTLSAYSEGVLYKGWKDYALNCESQQTTFCVIERGEGAPMAIIYSLSRTRSQKTSGRDFYRVYDGQSLLCRTESFLEALNMFREMGKVGTKKSKKFKIIK